MKSGLPRTNPDSSRVEDLNQGPPNFKSRALTTRPHCLAIYNRHNEEMLLKFHLVTKASFFQFVIVKCFVKLVPPKEAIGLCSKIVFIKNLFNAIMCKTSYKINTTIVVGMG